MIQNYPIFSFSSYNVPIIHGATLTYVKPKLTFFCVCKTSTTVRNVAKQNKKILISMRNLTPRVDLHISITVRWKCMYYLLYKE